jgi:tetrathionate reductase subunit B
VKYSFFVFKTGNHREAPVCAQVCPKNTTFNTSDGAVLIDEDRCIGCLCRNQSRPYGARYLSPISA